MGLLLGLLQFADAEANGVEYTGAPAMLDRVGADIGAQMLSVTQPS
jgi:hypothetical protein